MIDIANMKSKRYVFKDGGKVIYTNNPTQELYTSFIQADTDEDKFEVFDRAFKFMLRPEDKHYASEIEFRVKVAIVKDYFEFHAKQLENLFPSSNNNY